MRAVPEIQVVPIGAGVSVRAEVRRAQELIRELRPRQAILTHLSHTIEYGEISARLAPGISLAYDGLTVEM